jgi:hypothetical protein
MKVMILINAVVMMFLTSCNKTEKEIHLIPAGYKGAVTIIFDCKEGNKLEYEGGTRVYRIGKDGVLKINAPSNEGVLKSGDQLFFFVDSLGNRTEIKQHKENYKSADTNDVMIFNLQLHGNCVIKGQNLNGSAVQYLVCREEERETFYQKRINPCDLYCK